MNNVFLLLTIIELIRLSVAHFCNHIPPNPEDVGFVHLESKHVLKKRSANHNLRIRVFHHHSFTSLPIDKFDVINNTVLPQALDYWQKALSVRPLQVPIRLSRKCPHNLHYTHISDPNVQYCIGRCENVTTCGEIVVPEEHLEPCHFQDSYGKLFRGGKVGPGVENADFVFYVSAMQTERCDKGAAVAYAAHCQQETGFERPVAGHANLCPDSISTKPQDIDTMISTVKHEILHALGFSVSLFGYYRDKNGEPLTKRGKDGKPDVDKTLNTAKWSEKVVKKFVRADWSYRSGYRNKSVYMMVTPRVVEEVRKHFNCSILEGAELEDQGGDGTNLTHWEKRVFENEAMTGTHTQSPIYSRITLALMEDTGWYLPNYEMAQPLQWGRNLGCDFVTKSCKYWIDSRRKAKKSISPFCDEAKKDLLETKCTSNREAVALCNLKKHDEELPLEYQNFDYIPGVKGDLSRYGGSVNLADYCPYIQEFTWKLQGVVVRGSKCHFAANNPAPEKNFALEYYGNNSKCFNHNKDMWEERSCTQVRQWQHWGSGCYQYSCETGRLNIIVANKTYTCYYRRQEIKIQRFVDGWLHTGAIVCPPCKEICQDMKCRPDKVKYKINAHHHYPKDILKCSSNITLPSVTVIIINLIKMFIFMKFTLLT